MSKKIAKGAIALSSLALIASAAQAADWSDTSIGYRTGSKFAEPFNNQDISKNIFNLNHVSGFKYGSNFFNVDLLMSDNKDASSIGSSGGAHEVYVVYRNTLDMSKLTGSSYKTSFSRDVGFTWGFDYNTKTDVGYNSKKRMLVAGPTLMLDVPGFLNVSVLALWESNQPSGWDFSANGGKGGTFAVSRYSYKVHPMLTAAWGVPFNLGTVPLSFEGFANFIASKGKDEFGGNTAAETNIDMEVMYDIGAGMGAGKNTFKLGLEYQYWKNKFGNDSSGPAGKGAFAKTPMIRAEYHF